MAATRPVICDAVRALFPDKKKRTLHLFSGKVDLTAFPGDTVDINPEFHPTYVDNAQTLRSVPLENYDLVWRTLPTASKMQSAIKPPWSSAI